jgi:hypothetical protein
VIADASIDHIKLSWWLLLSCRSNYPSFHIQLLSHRRSRRHRQLQPPVFSGWLHCPTGTMRFNAFQDTSISGGSNDFSYQISTTLTIRPGPDDSVHRAVSHPLQAPPNPSFFEDIGLAFLPALFPRPLIAAYTIIFMLILVATALNKCAGVILTLVMVARELRKGFGP